jgi:hypothetical protein
MKLILLLCLGFMLNAQKYQNVIYESSQEFLDKKESKEAIKSIKFRFWHEDLEVRYQNGKKERIDVKTIWGYQNNYGAVARWIPERKKFFYIRETKGVVAYIGEFKKETYMQGGTPVQPTRFDIITSPLNFFWGERHSADEYPFFSKTLDSEPFPFSWEELKTQYADDACFVAKMNEAKGLFKPSYEIDDKTKRLKINQLYKECHSNEKSN